MAPILMATEPGSNSAHSRALQNHASHVGSTAETIRASGNGAIFNHAKSRRSLIHRKSTLGLTSNDQTRNSKIIIVESGPCIALHEAPLEFKLWQ